MSKVFNRDIELAGSARITKNGSVLIDEQGDIRAPIDAALASGKIFVGDSNGVASEVAMSGDATISNTGVMTVAAATGGFAIGTNVLFVKEVNHTVTVGTSTTSNTAGGNLTQTAGAASGTATGGSHSIVAGAGGASSGQGGQLNLTGGAAGGGNANGGNVVITGGALAGSGRPGFILLRSKVIEASSTGATAKTVSSTLTAADLAPGIVTINQAAGAASVQTLPTAADMDTALPDLAAGDYFDVSFINTSTVDAEDASVATNTGWTLVGAMDFLAYNAAGVRSSGILRLRKTGSAAWTAYRIA